MTISLEQMMVGEAITFYRRMERLGLDGDIDFEWLSDFTAAKVMEKKLLGDIKTANRLNQERNTMLNKPEETLHQIRKISKNDTNI